jgi:NADPH-dependent ferric siderophore reductase
VLVGASAGVELPEGVGHAYVGGELGVVREITDTLRARGMSDERVSPKSYWSLGRANLPHGEPGR